MIVFADRIAPYLQPPGPSSDYAWLEVVSITLDHLRKQQQERQEWRDTLRARDTADYRQAELEKHQARLYRAEIDAENTRYLLRAVEALAGRLGQMTEAFRECYKALLRHDGQLQQCRRDLASFQELHQTSHESHQMLLDMLIKQQAPITPEAAAKIIRKDLGFWEQVLAMLESHNEKLEI